VVGAAPRERDSVCDRATDQPSNTRLHLTAAGARLW